MISKPMRDAKAWQVQEWDDTAITQLFDVMAGVKMLSLEFEMSVVIRHAATALATFWST